MNELSVEEKAKRYDEAIEAINKCETDKYGCIIGIKPTDIFPELKENMDKKIRKAIRTLILSVPDIYEKTGFSRSDVLAWLEKQGEQKPTDKAEPKFKIGNWLVHKNIKGVFCITQIASNYYLTNIGSFITFGQEDNYRPWTIQDAKEGDALAFNDGHGTDCIELIKSITDKKIEFWFCLTNGNSYEVFDGITPYTNLASREDATPATKEQRDLLFAKMKEAGYEWDAEKKELKKIERKVAWSKKDDRILDGIIEEIEANKSSAPDYDILVYDRYLSFLKSLKERYTWKPSDEQIKAIRLARAFVTDDFSDNPTLSEILIELENQLKKLMEE